MILNNKKDKCEVKKLKYEEPNLKIIKFEEEVYTDLIVKSGDGEVVNPNSDEEL